MALSPKSEELIRHIVLLHSLRDAGPEVHAALMGQNVPEEQVNSHLASYAKKLHGDIQASAQGDNPAAPDAPADGKSKGSKRAFELADSFEAAEPAKSDDDKAASRQARVGKLFKR